MRQRFGFYNWRKHDAALWHQVRDEATQRHQIAISKKIPAIMGYDIDNDAIYFAKNNLRRAGMEQWIELYTQALKTFSLPKGMSETPCLVVTNPPFGERLNEVTSLIPLYQELGGVLAALPANSQASVLTSDAMLAKAIGLYSHKQYALYNGVIACRLYQYHIRENCQAKYATTTTAIPAAAEMLYNRLTKNHKHLTKWLNKNNITNYRLYDADIPEYAFAIDIYNDWAHVQEYMPPSDINPLKAQQRLLDALIAIPRAMNIPTKQIVIKQRQRQRGSAQYQREKTTNQQLTVMEASAKFLVNLHDFLDTGLFLDHRPLRLKMASEAAGKTFLNLFCYTATASVHAALADATTTNIDMSHTYLEWAQQNFRLNHLNPNHHFFIQEDCLQWLEYCSDKFDVIFLDPPSFSNSKRMYTTLDIQRDHVHLITLSMRLLKPNGILYFSNNFKKFKLDPSLHETFTITDITSQTIAKDFEKSGTIHHCFMLKHPHGILSS